MKKIIAFALVVVMCLGMVACGAKKTEETADKKETAKLVMGTNAAFEPYEFLDENGKIIGIDAEIAQAIADKMGVELEIKDMDFDGLVAAVQGGAIDFAMAGMTVTDERKESVNFSDTYATGIQAIIVADGSKIKTVDDLEGHKIGVQSGTTGDIYCTDDFGEENVKQYKTGPEAVAALLQGIVDCVVIDNEPAKALVAANEGLTILETEYAVEDYAIAIAKENEDLLKDVNDALKALKDDGTIDGIVAKYIHA